MTDRRQHPWIAAWLTLWLLAATACERPTEPTSRRVSTGRATSSSVPPPAESPPDETAATIAGLKASRSGLHYVERSLGTPDPGSPLIVAVHGLGDRPASFIRIFDRYPASARVIAPRAPRPHGRGYSWFEFRRNQAQDEESVRRMSVGMKSSADLLASLLAELAELHGQKPILTGFSQGGMLTFIVATHHPSRIRVALPIGGWLPPPLWPRRPPGPAIVPRLVALHGKSDRIVPVEPTRAGVEHLRALGWPAELVTFDGVGHAVPQQVRARLFSDIRALQRASGGSPKR